jgi:hypothetical protein
VPGGQISLEGAEGDEARIEPGEPALEVVQDGEGEGTAPGQGSNQTRRRRRRRRRKRAQAAMAAMGLEETGGDPPGADAASNGTGGGHEPAGDGEPERDSQATG